MAKHIEGEALRERLISMRERWPAIRERVSRQLVSPERAATMLRMAGARTTPT